MVGGEARDRLTYSVVNFCLRNRGLQGALPQLLGPGPILSWQGCSNCTEEPCLPFTKVLLNFGCWGYVFAYAKLEGSAEM